MKHERGFTLIELTIALAMIALLTLFAVPNYRRHIWRTQQAAAMQCLLGLDLQVQRRIMRTGASTNFIMPTDGCVRQSEHYSFDSVDAINDLNYALRAARNDGRNSSDGICAALQLDQTGTWIREPGVGASIC